VKDMADQDHNQEVTGRLASTNNALDCNLDRNLDRDLDAALAKYAAVEPRPGLEQRVLANLLAERRRETARASWRWPAAALAALAVLLAVTLIWRLDQSAPDHASQPPTPTLPSAQAPTIQLARDHGSDHEKPAISPAAKKSAGHDPPPSQRMVAATQKRNPQPYPKLDQFPSPEPLSEQEKILADYVAHYPEHVALIARARAEALRRDAAEESNGSATGSEENSTQ